MRATPDTLADPQQTIAEFQRQLAKRTAERDEARAQQTAMAEVLQVINSSSGDIKPVFDAILGKALDLCDAAFGALCVYEGDHYYRALAQQGFSPEMTERFSGSVPISPGSNPGRLRAGEEIIAVADLTAEPPHREWGMGCRPPLPFENVCSGFSKGTVAGGHSNGEEAPNPAVGPGSAAPG
jgi:hypothetical protein